MLRWAAENDGSDELIPEMGDLILLELLDDRCETVLLEPGENLIEVGAPCEEMFLVKSGTLTAWGVGADERRTRFRRVGAGSVIGEVAFVAGGVRTATVTADGNAAVLRLSVDAYERLVEEDARLALQVQAELSKRIAERLSYTSAAYQRAMNT